MGVDVSVSEKERERAKGQAGKADVRSERVEDSGTIFLDLLLRWSFHPSGD